MVVTVEREGRIEAAAGPPTGVSRSGALRTAALFLIFLGFYLLTTGGHLYAVDEETLFRATESVVERGTLALPPDAWGLVTSEQRTGGALYSQYEPGQSLAAIPFYLLGKALAPRFPTFATPTIIRFAVSLFGAFVAAATVALLYRVGLALGYRERTTLAGAAIYGLATTAWPYARTFYAEPLTALCLLATLHAIRRGTERSGAHGWLAWGGAVAGLSLFVKPHAALVLPFLGLYLLGRVAGSPPWSVATLRRVLLPALVWGVAAIVGTVPLLIGNAIMYGGPFTTGYSAGRLEGLAYPFFKGLYGLLLSPGKGVAWYSPPLVLALLAAWPFFRRRRAEALACLGITLVHLAFYSRLTLWNGDWAWGPRYLLVILPFMYLPILAFLDAARGWHWRTALATAVVVIGVGVQLLGVLVNPVWPRAQVYDLVVDNADRDARIEARFFSPASSPLVVHARLLGERIAEWRDRITPPPDTAVIGSGFADVEGGADKLFPRWTGGAGMIALHSGGGEPLTVKLTFFDHRPAALRTVPSAVLVNGRRLPDSAIERSNFTGDGEGWTYQFVVPGGRNVLLTLLSAPWNPRLLGVGDRDETLGVFVHNVEVWRLGQPWPVRDDAATAARRTIPALPTSPENLYEWFNAYQPFGAAANGTVVHHAVDHWAWYLAIGGLPRGLVIRSMFIFGTIVRGAIPPGADPLRPKPACCVAARIAAPAPPAAHVVRRRAHAAVCKLIHEVSIQL
ncbi:MAG: hypothetical protein U0841_02135 [Chloroflexia bacterium]